MPFNTNRVCLNDSMGTDDELIAAHLDGNPDAYTTLLQRHLKGVYNFVLRIAPQDAEDVTQETFVKAWKNISRFRVEESFRTWLLKIARNTAIDFLRKRRTPSFSEFGNEEEGEFPYLDAADPAPSLFENLALAGDKADIDRLVKTLSPGHQETLHLHYVEDLTFREIAEILNRPQNSVKSQHRRALLALKKLLDAPKRARNT